MQYADYSLWQRRFLGREEEEQSLAARQIAYWKNALAELPAEIPLPLDRSRPRTPTYRGGVIRFEVSAAVHGQLHVLARWLTAKQDGLEKYKGDWMKHELIEERAGDIFSEYTLGPHFIDFCRGPHVPSTEKLKAFKLLSIAGAYWKGRRKEPAASAHLRHRFLH